MTYLFKPRVGSPDMTLCRASIFNGWSSHQCSRKKAVERDGIGYCKQHDPIAVQEKRDARDAERRAYWRAQEARDAREAHRRAWTEKAVAALRQIAAEHNDPGALAREVLSEEEYRPQQ